MNAAEIQRPRFQTLPLAEGLTLRAGGGWLAQEKKDGVWNGREWRGHVLCGELMPNGTFWPFDLCCFNGEDVRRQQLRVRLSLLAELKADWPDTWREIPTGTGAEFLEAVLRDGGDVIEVGAHSRTASGKLREPRFLRVRTDKANL